MKPPRARLACEGSQMTDAMINGHALVEETPMLIFCAR